MSLAEIKSAITELSPEDMVELVAFIQAHDGLAWEQEIETDFAPGGKHHSVLADIDAAIDEGRGSPLS